MSDQLLKRIIGKLYYMTGKKFNLLEKKLDTFSYDELQEFNQFLQEIESKIQDLKKRRYRPF